MCYEVDFGQRIIMMCTFLSFSMCSSYMWLFSISVGLIALDDNSFLAIVVLGSIFLITGYFLVAIL